MQQYLLSLLLFALPASNQAQWLVNYREAQNQAQREQKAILIVFSGSDWCRPCIQMEQEVFSQTEFLSFATHKLVLLKVDFPRRKKNQLQIDLQQHHTALAARYNPQGAFPWVVLVDPDGEILLQTGFQTGQKATFIQRLQQALE